MKAASMIHHKITNFLEGQITLEREYNTALGRLRETGVSHGSRLIEEEKRKFEGKMMRLQKEFDSSLHDLERVRYSIIEKKVESVPDDTFSLIGMYAGKSVPEEMQRLLVRKCGSCFNALRLLERLTGIEVGVESIYNHLEKVLGETERMMKGVKPYHPSYDRKTDEITGCTDITTRYDADTFLLYQGEMFKDIETALTVLEVNK